LWFVIADKDWYGVALRFFALLVRFDGSQYHGWQVQRGQVTVCQVLRDAIAQAVGHPVSLHGCGRTDAGVHALHYVAGFSADTRIPADRLPYALNTRLPDSISVRQAAEVPASFNAIGSCNRKEYTYWMYLGHHPDPFLCRRALFLPGDLDLAGMERAAGDFIGKHDFRAFRSQGSAAVKSTERLVFTSAIRTQGRYVIYKVSASGFLYNQVRTMLGTLLYIGHGKLPPGSIPDLLAGGRRNQAGPTAPPHGLYMTGAWYNVALPWPPYQSLDTMHCES